MTIALGGYFYLFHTSTLRENSIPEFARSVCMLQPGYAAGYDISAFTKMEYTLPFANQTGRQKAEKSFEAAFSFQVQKKMQGYSILQGRFDYTDGEAERFLFQLHQDCSFSDFKFRQGTTSREKQVEIVGFLKELHFSIPAKLSVEAWKSLGADSMGEYVAGYKRVSSSEGRLRLEKKKLNYHSVKQTESERKLTVEIVASKTTITLNESTLWIESMDVAEIKVMKINGDFFAKTVFTLTITGKKKSPLRFDAIPAEELEDFRAPILGEKVHSDVKEQYQSDHAVEDVKGKTIQDAITSFESMLNESSSSTKEALDMLVQYLSVNAGAASKLIETVRRGETAEKAESMIFLALELTSDNEAQEALQTVLTTDDFSSMNRMRAAIALQDLAVPAQKSVDALVSMVWRIPDTDPDHLDYDVARTSALSLGTLAKNQRKANPFMAQAAEEQLVSQLNASQESDVTAIMLEAIGNTHNPSMEAEVRKFLAADSSPVRAAAASAIGNLHGPDSETLLFERFVAEDSATVRQRIVASLARVESVSTDTVKFVSASLINEPRDSVRTEIIKFIGPFAKTDPEIKATLLEQLKREGNDGTIQLIGEYLK
ncbi:MAG: HEAT repeat domain-containing protein [Mariprofundaceae bacterium]